MADVALVLLVVYGVVGLLFRMVVQLRLTGSTGFRGISGTAVEMAGGILLVVAFGLAVAAPVLADAIDPLGPLDHDGVRVAGVALAAAGIVGTAAAQLAMGGSWRIGVDPSERTSLVTSGPFALVRNPIYAAMIPFFAGVALMVGNWVGVAGAACALLSLELQTRAVEEPHLLRSHGEEYARYAARVGRFVPGVGRLRG